MCEVINMAIYNEVSLMSENGFLKQLSYSASCSAFLVYLGRISFHVLVGGLHFAPTRGLLNDESCWA